MSSIMARVLAVCTSTVTGIRKEPMAEVVLKEDLGVEGDAHAGLLPNRQVSLLAMESIDKMRQRGYAVGIGDFAENITTTGIEISSLPVGARLRVGREAILEITQIGKQCHTGCAVFKQVGSCIMPKEGVFARVVRGGMVKAGDVIIEEHQHG